MPASTIEMHQLRLVHRTFLSALLLPPSSSAIVAEMKLLIAISTLVVLVTAEYKIKTAQDLATYREECFKSQNVPAENLETYKKWNFPDDEVTHRYLQCVFEKLELFNKETGFVVNDIHHQLVGHHNHGHDDETHAKIEKCADKNEQGSDSATWAYRGATCFIKENLQLVQQSVKKD